MRPLIEQINFHPAIMPLDLDTDRTGDYISLENYGRVGVLAIISPGTAGDDPTLTLYQAKDTSGTDAEAAEIITTYWTKQAATDLTGTGTWTKSTQTAASTVAGNATSAEQAKCYYFEVDASQLDVDNGFKAIRVDIALAASGGAQYGTVLYVAAAPAYPQETLTSPL